MINAEKILHAVAHLVFNEGQEIFSRKDVRKQIGVDSPTWLNSYTAIFQSMRVYPGSAPGVRDEFKHVFRQVSRGKYIITDYGREVISRYHGGLSWRDAVLNALNRYSQSHRTRMITRQELILEELDTIILEAKSVGATPAQTLSRVLQELRDENILFFQGDGRYLLLDDPIDVENEEWPDDAIDFAIEMNKLKLRVVAADDKVAMTRQRRGQNRIRKLTLQNYDNQCSMCDAKISRMLIASHISRWADDPDGRGDLQNVLSLCKLHDPLFEEGYLSLSNTFEILKKGNVQSKLIQLVIDKTNDFRKPFNWVPAPNYLVKHRIRTGFEY